MQTICIPKIRSTFLKQLSLDIFHLDRVALKMLSHIMLVITYDALTKHRGKTMKYKRLIHNESSTPGWEKIKYVFFLLTIGQHVIAGYCEGF